MSGFFSFFLFSFWKRASSILEPASIDVEVAAWYKGLGLLLHASPSPSRQRVTVENTPTIIIIITITVITIIITCCCCSVATHGGAAGKQNRPGPLLPVSCPVCQTKTGQGGDRNPANIIGQGYCRGVLALAVSDPLSHPISELSTLYLCVCHLVVDNKAH